MLVVDDDDRNRKLAVAVLESAGVRCLAAVDGAQAMTLAAAARPDVILMDLRLPDLDGAEVTRRLAADPRTATIPVVALTATPLDPADDWAADAGFAGYLVKPTDVDQLRDLVRDLSARTAR
ncbi:MAG TPA: response regulator [Candidatus Dormibacteraeota bacterium]|nr:response regulator [Candidatus Dormibacteraeota bacterium]